MDLIGSRRAGIDRQEEGKFVNTASKFSVLAAVAFKLLTLADETEAMN